MVNIFGTFQTKSIEVWRNIFFAGELYDVSGTLQKQFREFRDSFHEIVRGISRILEVKFLVQLRAWHSLCIIFRAEV